MKKTLAEILSESREQAQKTVDVIDKLIEKSKEAGIEWPELEEPKKLKGVIVGHKGAVKHGFDIGDIVTLKESPPKGYGAFRGTYFQYISECDVHIIDDVHISDDIEDE